MEIWVGRPQPGWCDKCNLPSKLTVQLYAPSDGGMSTVGTVTQCDGCRNEESF